MVPPTIAPIFVPVDEAECCPVKFEEGVAGSPDESDEAGCAKALDFGSGLTRRNNLRRLKLVVLSRADTSGPNLSLYDLITVSIP